MLTHQMLTSILPKNDVTLTMLNLHFLVVEVDMNNENEDEVGVNEEEHVMYV